MTEKWLKNKETPSPYSVAFFHKAKSNPSFERVGQSKTGGIQRVTKTMSGSEEHDSRIKLTNYDITHNLYKHKRRLTLTIIPNENVGSTLMVSYWIDYSKSSYFESLIGKWKIIINGQEWVDEDLIKMCENLKINMESN